MGSPHCQLNLKRTIVAWAPRQSSDDDELTPCYLHWAERHPVIATDLWLPTVTVRLPDTQLRLRPVAANLHADHLIISAHQSIRYNRPITSVEVYTQYFVILEIQ